MSIDSFDAQCIEPELIEHIIKLAGAGTSVPGKTFGRGVTVGRTGVGVITLTYAEFPGTYVGLTGFGFESATQAGLKGYTVVTNAITSSVITINITSAAEALTDLASGQSLTLKFAFKRVNA